MSLRRSAFAAPLLLLLLAGCVPTPAPTGPATSGSPTATATPTPTPTPTPTVTITPTPSPETEPVALGCADLISADAIYDYNPNVSLLDSFSPDQGSLAATAVAQQGVACRLVNQTSGEVIDIGVVRFTSAAFDAKQASVSASSTPTGAFDGYFDSGVAQAFASPYWVTVTSSAFLEGADAASIVGPVVSSLG